MYLLIVQSFWQQAVVLASQTASATQNITEDHAGKYSQPLPRRTTCDNTGIAANQLPAMPAPCWGAQRHIGSILLNPSAFD
jgi:hypothetical protein